MYSICNEKAAKRLSRVMLLQVFFISSQIRNDISPQDLRKVIQQVQKNEVKCLNWDKQSICNNPF